MMIENFNRFKRVQFTWAYGNYTVEFFCSIRKGKTEGSVKRIATEIVNALETEMQSRLIKKITACLTDGGSLSNLKKDCFE
ncbi:transcription factor TFIIIC subunit tfc4 [Mucor velutinosus]|uniref:Transcription factor TFIIIC subunit tfc4 n=1 Tax=Mucor velutinosus TaxID=708070 RepID=A0AAN7HJL7_9FUNG|nr:transcription factor TFIIIC subunit tfc4 [Mucor velutinosus]